MYLCSAGRGCALRRQFLPRISRRLRPAPQPFGYTPRVALRFNPPAGKIGAAPSTMLGKKPSSQIEKALKKFKQLMEADEITTAAEGRQDSALEPDRRHGFGRFVSGK